MLGCMVLLSHVRLFVTPWAVAHQAPPSMGFSRQEYWSGLPFPSSEDLPNPEIEPRSPSLQADALTSEPPVKTRLCLVCKKSANCLPKWLHHFVSPANYWDLFCSTTLPAFGDVSVPNFGHPNSIVSCPSTIC